MTIATSGLGFQGRRSIDHIALSEDLTAESLGVVSNIDEGEQVVRPLRVVASLSARSEENRVGPSRPRRRSLRDAGEDGLLDEPVLSEFDDSEWVWGE